MLSNRDGQCAFSRRRRERFRSRLRLPDKFDDFRLAIPQFGQQVRRERAARRLVSQLVAFGPDPDPCATQVGH
jgi:hypothetical protein